MCVRVCVRACVRVCVYVCVSTSLPFHQNICLYPVLTLMNAVPDYSHQLLLMEMFYLTTHLLFTDIWRQTYG